MKKFKKFVLCTFLLLLTLPSFAQTGGVNWEKGTLQDALKKAKTSKKGAELIFLDCYTEWCGPCKYMVANIFPQEAAGNYFNKNFVNIKIDMEKGEGLEIAKKYAVMSYPTFLILDADGNEIGRIMGGGGELEAFINKVDRVKDIKNSPKYVKSAFDADKTFNNALAYLKSLDDAYLNDQIVSFMIENLTTFKVQDIFSAQNWKYFSRNLAGKNPDLLRYLIENKTAANTYLGKDVVDKAIINAYSSHLASYLRGRKMLSKEEVKGVGQIITLLAGDNNKKDLFYADLAILYADKNLEAIAALYKFSNFTSYTLYDIQSIERVFNSMKEITKEQKEQYYKDKAAFFAK